MPEIGEPVEVWAAGFTTSFAPDHDHHVGVREAGAFASSSASRLSPGHVRLVEQRR